MAHSKTIWALLATAAAAASVQSCADGSAEPIEVVASQTPNAQTHCVDGTTPVPVGAETHCRLSGVITADLHLTADAVYQIDGRVQIGEPLRGDGIGVRTTLTIDPGVTLYAADRAAVLEIARGSRLYAEGAPGAPIVFTSAYDLGLDDELALAPRTNLIAPRGEWGGIVVSGLAPVAAADGFAGATCAQAEAAEWCELAGEMGAGPFGGSGGAADSSGAIRHVEIRYAGAFAQGDDVGRQRMPALLLQGVGAGTPVAYVSISNAYGDGVQLRGGAVEIENLSVVGAGDDGVDWSDGYRGVMRRVVVAHDARLGDGDNGFEGAGGPGALFSAPRLIDVAVIGDPAVSRHGLLLRDGTDVSIDGAVISGVFANGGLDIDGEASYRLITANDLARVAINEDGADALSTDFDDTALAGLFNAGPRSNQAAPVELTLAQALLALDDGLALNANLFAEEDTPEQTAPRAAPQPATTTTVRFNPVSAAPLTPASVMSAPALVQPTALADPLPLPTWSALDLDGAL